MLSTSNAIVLSKIKYGDHDLIIKCYNQKYGVIGYVVRGALRTKKTKTKIAYFQLLSQLQIVSNYNPARWLHTIKEVKPYYIYNSLHSNVMKSAVVIFLAEILVFALKEEEKNEELYNYLETAMQWFDVNDTCPNFHLLFLLNLTKYLGFYPDTSALDGQYFNLQEGIFETKSSGKYAVSSENLILLKRLLGTTFDALSSIKINASQRQSFLNMILLYFELHLGGFKTPKSLQVFNQVFN